MKVRDDDTKFDFQIAVYFEAIMKLESKSFSIILVEYLRLVQLYYFVRCFIHIGPLIGMRQTRRLAIPGTICLDGFSVSLEFVLRMKWSNGKHSKFKLLIPGVAEHS